MEYWLCLAVICSLARARQAATNMPHCRVSPQVTNNLFCELTYRLLTLIFLFQARLEGGDGSGTQGKETVLKALEKAVASKIKGLVKNIDTPRVMRSGETRAVITAGKLGITVKMGNRLRWSGGLIVYIQFQKGADPLKFYEDDTEALKRSSTRSIETLSEELSESSMNDAEDEDQPHAGLSPPWLVPRPKKFPPPRIIVRVIGAQGLKNGRLRPVKSFVRLKVGNAEARTETAPNGENPVWQNSEHALVFDRMNPDCRLEISIIDVKPGANRCIGVTKIPIPSLSATEDASSAFVTKELDVKMRRAKLRNKGCTAKLTVELALEDFQGWWLGAERAARDAETAKENEVALRSAAEKGERGAKEEIEQAEQAGGFSLFGIRFF